MSGEYAAVAAVANQASTIKAMRAEGLARVDAYWERREQRAFDAIFIRDHEILAALAQPNDRVAPAVPSFSPRGWDVVG